MSPSKSSSAGALATWWTTRRYGQVARRAAWSFLAAVVADLIVGFGVFSVAVLSIIWYFSFSWIGLVRGYAAIGQGFGTASQLLDAALLLGVSPAMIGIVAFLSVRALRLPRALWRLGHRPSTPAGSGATPATSSPWYRRIDWRPGGSESHGLGSAMFALAGSRK